MNRAILIGDGQLEIFESLDEAVNSLEPPEVAGGDFLAYTEDGFQWKLELKSQVYKYYISKDIEIDIVFAKKFGKWLKKELELEINIYLGKISLLSDIDAGEDIFDFLENCIK